MRYRSLRWSVGLWPKGLDSSSTTQDLVRIPGLDATRARGAKASEGCCPRSSRGYGDTGGDEDELLSLAGKLRKVPEAFERYVSTTTHQYVGHVLGLVKSYWPTTRLDALGKGAKADCTDEQFRQYLEETSVVANQIVESLIKPESPWTFGCRLIGVWPQVLWTNIEYLCNV